MWPSVALVFAALTARLYGLSLTSHPINDRPIIGILAQENPPHDNSTAGSTYIPACYVKFLEAGGARVVPIRTNRTEEEYKKIFFSINGLFLPGGEVNLRTSEFTRVAKIFYNLALKANDVGDYFPIWGICLGFQQLVILTANKRVITVTHTTHVALPLTFTQAAQSSRLFQNFPKDLLQALAEENITSNYHDFSLTVQTYNHNAKLKRFYKVLSTNTYNKKQFISTIEAYHYPFYAVQWHPEKNVFEWIDRPGMVHSVSAKMVSFYTSSFFVSEAMKNQHRFSSPLEEEKALIYNYSPVFKGNTYKFVQIYYFD